MITGPGDETAAAGSRTRSELRSSRADREQAIGTLKAAFVQGRLTADELDTRMDRAFTSRTYAELAEATADIPAPAGTQSPRDPWRATKIAWRIEYAIVLPAVVAFLFLHGGPRTTAGETVILTAIVYLLFWILGVSMSASRPAKRSAGPPPPRSAPGARGSNTPVAMKPGEEIVAGGRRLPVTYADRERATRTLTAALAQGRLTEDEHGERAARASASRSHSELASLTADLPAGLTALPPTARDVRLAVCMSVAAACVLAPILLWRPDNGLAVLAFLAFLAAAAILIVVPVITAGLIVDVWHQKRSGGQLPPRPIPATAPANPSYGPGQSQLRPRPIPAQALIAPSCPAAPCTTR